MLERNHSSSPFWLHVKSQITSGLIKFAYMCKGLSVTCMLLMLGSRAVRAAQNVKEVSKLRSTHSTAQQCYSACFKHLEYSRALAGCLTLFGITFIVYIHFA